MTEPRQYTVDELAYFVKLHANTRAMNRVLSPVLERSEAEAIAKYEAAKANQ